MARKSFVFLVIGAVIFFLCPISSADVPGMINYQGKLTTSEGALVNDTVQMTFSIYPDTLGSPADWTETQDSVVVKEGIFNVLLGSVDSIPTSVFDESIKYLGVQVESDPEMKPLKPMVSVAYAYRAGTADGGGGGWVGDSGVVRLADSADYVGIGTDSPIDKLEVKGNSGLTITSSDPWLRLNETDVPNKNGQIVTFDGKLQLGFNDDGWISWSPKVTIQEDGNVGIGTTTPQSRLHVENLTLGDVETAVQVDFGNAVALTTVKGIVAEYTGSGANYDATAVYGRCYPEFGYGVGGDFSGGHVGVAGSSDYIGVNGSVVNNEDGARYGVYGYAYGALTTSIPYGVYGSANGNTTAYGVYGRAGGSGPNIWAGYFNGRVYAQGNVGIGTETPVNKLDVEGGVAVGAGYSGTNTAPTNGMIIEGNVGIGNTDPQAPLEVGNAQGSTLNGAIIGHGYGVVCNGLSPVHGVIGVMHSYPQECNGYGVYGVVLGDEGIGVWGEGGQYGVVSNGNARVQGNLSVTGKITSNGGYDPPYVLYDKESRKAIIERVAKEVPADKLDGAVLFWNGDDSRFEVYLPAKGEFRDLLGTLLATANDLKAAR